MTLSGREDVRTWDVQDSELNSSNCQRGHLRTQPPFAPSPDERRAVTVQLRDCARARVRAAYVRDGACATLPVCQCECDIVRDGLSDLLE